MCPGVSDQGVCQSLPLRRSESEMGKELRLAGSFRMVERQKVVREFASFDQCLVCIRKIHWSALAEPGAPAWSRTSILPVTAAVIRAARYSVNLSIASSIFLERLRVRFEASSR